MIRNCVFLNKNYCSKKIYVLHFLLYLGQFLGYMDPFYHFGILKVSSFSTCTPKYVWDSIDWRSSTTEMLYWKWCKIEKLCYFYYILFYGIYCACYLKHDRGLKCKGLWPKRPFNQTVLLCFWCDHFPRICGKSRRGHLKSISTDG